MFRISKLVAREILDSRGNPTVEVLAKSKDVICKASVPSGASKSVYEALELRDSDKKRYQGRGVNKAVNNINKIIAKRFVNRVDISNQQKVDQTLIDLDGTENKSKLGANAILAVSLVCARAAALRSNKPLYKHIASSVGNKKLLLPVPFCNVINGGKHAGNNLEIQEIMIAPNAKSFADATRIVDETYFELKQIIKKKYGRDAINVGDEGGFAPPVDNASQALDLLYKAIEELGYSKKLKIGMDAAASEYFHGGFYMRNQMTKDSYYDHINNITKTYKIASMEDPFDEDDYSMWKKYTKSNKNQIVGDDLLATHPEKIRMAGKEKLCNALLLKVNQIGTVSEAIDAYKLAKKFKWKTMVSHRSGETNDSFIADLAVGLGNGQIKIGSPCRGERVAKYNRLMEIEAELKNSKYGKF